MVDSWRIRLAFAGLHPDRVRGLVDRFGSPRAVARAIERGKIETPDRAREAVSVDPKQRVAEMRKMGVSMLVRGVDGYPERLAVFPDAPEVLFVRGTLPIGSGVAVIGTRRCTSYGKRVARDYGQALAQAGVVVVSGLARGIDGAAHRGMVAAGGRGVAVLGSGIDVLYPREHAKLSGEIVDLGGAIVTEYPPGTPPEGWRFPPRNRIIAGLAEAVVVVEAAARGGALITAGKALEYGVPVLAVPGDVERDTSRGCNLLIRDGAHPVLDPEDLLEEVSLLIGY